MKSIKTFNSILACGLLLMSIGSAFGQTMAERKLELVEPIGHTFIVECVVFSPNGKTLASGGGDNVIKLWDVESGKQFRTLTGHSSSVLSLSFNPDGTILASGSLDNTIRLWDVQSGRELQILEGYSSSYSVFFSGDGKTIFSGGMDNPQKSWDAATGKLLPATGGRTLWRRDSLNFTGKTLASSNYTAVITLSDMETGNEIQTLKGHTEAVYSVAFSPDGKILASGGWDQTVKLWDVKSGKELHTLIAHSGSVTSVAFSPNGKILASGSWDQTVKLWDTESGKEIKTLRGYTSGVRSISFSLDGKILASGGNDNKVKLWSLNDAKSPQTIAGYPSSVLATSFDINGKTLISGSLGNEENTIKLWDALLGKELKTFSTLKGSASSIVFSKDGKTLSIGNKDGTIELWSVTNGTKIKTITAYSKPIYSLIFSPNSRILASGGDDKVIKLWNVDTGEEIKTFTSRNSSIYSLTFSSDGKTLAAGGEFVVEAWNIENGLKLQTFGQLYVGSVAFIPNTKILATVLNSSKIKLWDITLGKEILTFVGHTASINSLVFNENGTILASGSREGIKLWRTATGEEIASLISIGEEDWAIITPDGRFDASEGALKLMHYAYGLEIINLEQLKEAYYEPGLLPKLLGNNKEPLRPIVPLRDVKLYPAIVSQTIAPDSTKLRIKLKNRGGGIGRVQVFVGNELGKKLAVEDARDKKLKANPNVAEAILEVDLRETNYLKGKENKITVVTSNYLKEIGKGNIQSRGSEIVWLADGTDDFQLPTLFAVIGGVSDYDGSQLDLKFAAKDAEDFANALSIGAKRLFCDKAKPDCLDKVNITTLSTGHEKPEEQPTKENFKRAFRAIAAQAKPEDIIVVYLAGHGVSFGGGTDSYFYLTKEARTASRDELAKVLTTSTISSEELTDWLTFNRENPDDIFVKAMKQVVILDTCAAGSAAEKMTLTAKRDLSGDQIRAIEFLKDKAGTFVLMASTADAPSYEASQFGQGLLTYTLLQGMKGAALEKSEYVDVQKLFSYAQTEVPRLAQNLGGIQRPIISAPLGKPFFIGQLTDAEKQKIQIAAAKPVLLRPLLTNPETGDDDLKLIPELRKLLDAESSFEVMKRNGKGEPSLIYVDDDNFPGGIRVTGTYSVEGDQIKVKAFLRRDNKTIAALPEIVANKEEIINKLIPAVHLELAKLN